MKAQLQFVERQFAAHGNGKLPVDNEALRFQFGKRVDHIREVTRERLTGFRLQMDIAPVAKSDATEAVPFRLVLPFVSGGDFVDGLRLHRRKRRLDWQCHFDA